MSIHKNPQPSCDARAGMTSGGSFNKQEQKQQNCCISHQFFKSATKNPAKIAVIHAAPSGADGTSGHQNRRKFINRGDSPFASCSAPVYIEDQCFSFNDVLKSVDFLSSRLRSILDGGDESHLVRPKSSSGTSIYAEQETSLFSMSLLSVPCVENLYKPKVLGIYMPPSVEYIISVLAVLRCGEAFLPLDPSWPKDRILSIVSSSNADLVIISGSSFGKGSYDELGNLDWLHNCNSCPLLCFSMEESLKECVDPLNLVWPCEQEKQRLFCYLMYTSGSTGKPKGVCGTEQGLLNRFLWIQELCPLYGEDILLFKTSTSFIDHLQEFLSAMLTASTLVIPPFNELKENPFSIVNFLQVYSINRLTAVPSLMRAILPAFKSQVNRQIQSSLKLLVLSGEVFPLSLWDALSNLLPQTSILNLYGSTEVSGDCTYFDCKRLPMILETEELTSVPIGVPISNCDVVLVDEADRPNQGEIFVHGLCVSNGYLFDSAIISFDSVKLHKNFICKCSDNDCGSQVYHRTGDLARQLECGDLVFLGRKDRTVKVSGQRVALEEIEVILREHPDVVDAAVISRDGSGELLLLEAFLLLKKKDLSDDFVRPSIRGWMRGKVPSYMIPNQFIFIESLPFTSSGKVDYAALASSHVQEEIGNKRGAAFLQVIKKAFCDALMVKEVSNDGDFFMLGGDSVAAAHVSYNLGIDMRLLYKFPTPSKLYGSLQKMMQPCSIDVRTDANWKLDMKADNWNMLNSFNSATYNPSCKLLENAEKASVSKRFKVGLSTYMSSRCGGPGERYGWPPSMLVSCSFSRCNKIIFDGEHLLSNTHQAVWVTEVPRNIKSSSIQELWKIHMESCVDASPLVVFKDHDAYLFIGSHAHKFICVDAKSGSVLWKVKLEGRIECSAAIVGDFSLVAVGCYRGNIYFLDFSNGSVHWVFKTHGEVKCQPVVDRRRQLLWCGSHDHHLYALDYRNYCCVYKLPCGGSIYGSPSIDEVNDIIYVASTSGRVTAISIKALPFYTLWQLELEVPVFGSLSVSSPNGHIICCLVDGNVVALDLSGSIIWKNKTDGPVFAGACISWALPSQVLICSRNGSVYSFEMENGDLLWEYNVGCPIIASVYVDEHLQLVSNPSSLPERVLCVCASSGSIHLLRLYSHVREKANQPNEDMVQEFARLELPGDIFSSPVMIGGRIFVGCRDDYVHCLAIET